MTRHRRFGAFLPPTVAVIASVALLSGVPRAAWAISRDEVIARAQTFAYHPWYCSADNLTGDDCPAGYESVYTVGPKMGLPYDWGGFMTVDVFDRRIAAGYAAGSYSSDGSLACTVGHDCSGFVSMCWDAGSHRSTLWIHQNLAAIDRDDMMAGDVFNYRGDGWGHVILWSHEQANGLPFLYESAGWGVHATYTQGWDYLDGYTPREFPQVTGPEPGDLLGTAANPIEVALEPDAVNPGWYIFVHSDDTRDSPSDMFDQCAADWDNWEAGPEVIYRLELDSPGRLAVSVEDDVADIDVHVYEALNEVDCVARAHESLEVDVDCGEYFIVADSWSGTAGGTPQSGTYTLTITYQPSDAACGEPHGYDVGRPGSPCGFPGDPALAACSPALGATTCLYTGDAPSDDSFCSRECGTHADCTDDFADGCCADIGDSDYYCLPAEYCDGMPTDDVGVAEPGDVAGAEPADADVAEPSPADAPPDAGPDALGSDLETDSDAPLEPDSEAPWDTSTSVDTSSQPGAEGDTSERPSRDQGESSEQNPSSLAVTTNSGCGCTAASTPSRARSGRIGHRLGTLLLLVLMVRRRRVWR